MCTINEVNVLMVKNNWCLIYKYLMYAVVDVSEHGQSMGYYFEPLSTVKLELKFLPVHGYTLAAHEWLIWATWAT